MNKKDKDLLIKDLSARVFYGVKVNIEKDYPNNPQVVERVAKDGEIIVDGIRAYDIYYYKPYLRPMSSMTEEETFEFIRISDSILRIGERKSICILSLEQMDWLNAHHFDYRGLIEKGLALEAPERMYKTE